MTTTDNSRADALTDLLPCPFCGADATTSERGKGASWHQIIACVNWCCSVSETGGTRDGMRASDVKLCNTRVAVAASPVEQHEAAPMKLDDNGMIPRPDLECAHDYVRSDGVCTECGAQPAPSARLEGTGNGAVATVVNVGPGESDMEVELLAPLAHGTKLYTSAPRTEVAGMSLAITEAEKNAIVWLIDLARAAFHAADDSEEREGADGREHVIDSTNFDGVSNALDALEALPDDKPGYTLDAGGKAEWALRRLLAAVPQPPSADAAAAPADERAAFEECIRAHSDPDRVDDRLARQDAYYVEQNAVYQDSARPRLVHRIA